MTPPVVVLHPTLAEAGAARCRASAAVELGPHRMRRSLTVGPHRTDASNLQVARIGESLVAVWPEGEGSLRLQPLADDGAPRGPAVTLAAEGAPALFSLVPHGREPLALLQVHRRCHRDNGARCIDSWWISASGAPAGAKLEEFLGHDNNNLSGYQAITIGEGVLAGKTFDDTRQGYAHAVCNYADPANLRPDQCPVVMPPPSLDLYAIGEAGAVVVTPLLAITERAQSEVLVPLADGALRGALHLSEDRSGQRQGRLRLVGREPVALPELGDLGRRGDVRAHLDAASSTISIFERARGDAPARVHSFRLDGARVAPPIPLSPGAPLPLGDLVEGRLIASDREIKLVRSLIDHDQSVGEALLLATASRKIIRFETMSALIWDRGRYVALNAVPARSAWTVTVRTIACD